MSGTIPLFSTKIHLIFIRLSDSLLYSQTYFSLNYNNKRQQHKLTATTNPLSRSSTKSVLSREQSKGVCACIHRSIGLPEFYSHDRFLALEEFSIDKNGGFP